MEARAIRTVLKKWINEREFKGSSLHRETESWTNTYTAFESPQPTSSCTEGGQTCDSSKPVLGRSISTVTLLDIQEAFRECMTGKASPGQMGAFLMAMTLHGEQPEWLVAAANVAKELSMPCPSFTDALDIVGTGGDGLDTFNASTTAALIGAACGLCVAKHGNRASTSLCGSADLLEAMGANLDVHAKNMIHMMNTCGFCFVFAQTFHPGLKHVTHIRRELGIRTIFNILGPLINPVQPRRMVVGVFEERLGPLLAEALQLSKVECALVVHGENGLDEVNPCGKTIAWFFEQASPIQRMELMPQDFGLSIHPLSEICGGDSHKNASILQEMFNGNVTAYPGILDFVLMNAAALLVVAAKTTSWSAGVQMARNALLSGQAKRVLERFIQASHQDPPSL